MSSGKLNLNLYILLSEATAWLDLFNPILPIADDRRWRGRGYSPIYLSKKLIFENVEIFEMRKF
jgi:hypothetical protein